MAEKLFLCFRALFCIQNEFETRRFVCVCLKILKMENKSNAVHCVHQCTLDLQWPLWKAVSL